MTTAWVSAGALTGSTNRPQLQHWILAHTARGLRYGNCLLSRDFTPASTSPPPTWAPRRDWQLFFPARSFGVRLRMRTAGIRAVARGSFIGRAHCLRPSPQRAFSFFNASFSRPYIPFPPAPSAKSESRYIFIYIFYPYAKLYSYY